MILSIQVYESFRDYLSCIKKIAQIIHSVKERPFVINGFRDLLNLYIYMIQYTGLQVFNPDIA